MSERIYVNAERTVLVTVQQHTAWIWVARRDHPSDTWGPPVRCEEEKR